MVGLKVAGFFTCVTLLPVMGQLHLNAEDATTKLATGSAQVVLAITTVALAIALVKVFLLYRKDMREENNEVKELVKENTAAFQKFLPVHW